MKNRNQITINLSVYYTVHSFLAGLIYPTPISFFIRLFPTIFFFFDRSRKKEHTHIGKFSSIRPFIQKVAQHSFHRDYVKNRMKKNPSVQRVLNEPLHYSIRSTLCNEINESKNKRNNISPALRWNN